MERIVSYFPQLTSLQQERLTLLGQLYRKWNDKINVISRKDIDALYVHHVLHSLAIAKIISFRPGTRVMDVGTGGGFPGIPLSIFFPEAEFYLIDSIAKKIKVVNEITAALELQNVKAEQRRVETVPEKFDFIVSRAVTAFPDFLKLIRNKIRPGKENELPNGVLYLKGGDFEEEIKPYRERIRIYTISDFFSDDFFETKKIIYMQEK